MRLLTTVFLTTTLLTPALAQEAISPVKQAEASRILFDTGIANRDAVLVLAAAKLRRTLGLSPTDRAPDGAEVTQDDSVLTADQMLQFARDFAVGDDLMLGLIEDVAAETTKGVTGGPVYNVASLGPKKTDTYSAVPFTGNDYAEIYIEAKDSSDLNLAIRDSQGRLVCSDTDVSAIAYCGWRPREDGAFSISVQNMSGRTVQYSMITN